MNINKMNKNELTFVNENIDDGILLKCPIDGCWNSVKDINFECCFKCYQIKISNYKICSICNKNHIKDEKYKCCYECYQNKISNFKICSKCNKNYITNEKYINCYNCVIQLKQQIKKIDKNINSNIYMFEK